ncbi:hypothetical protein L228DRAFT_247694 [Xylona heveae TC161]|uniref:Acetoacetate decarboxylase n=1 Tax=Xylona heveae (strain CBS 132557 / TC161) TaxID=1328760 RepID=A0A165GE17_XYLHT|nr:hypothetical protein L228DRAFT_247694 [Xylona heveae TC161]KZF22079.1 hypothetical protein L228DRAFT_247694 [Xylona heveae TC161]
MMSAADSSSAAVPVPLAPPPWKCKCEVYWIPYYARTHGSDVPPVGAYAPLEAAWPPFADPAKAGSYRGGLGLIQILRYIDSPVGKYDELVLVPGYFDVPLKSQKKGQKNLRVTRIYVSQEDTAYNGRRNWNIPKHLARFSFTNISAGSSGPKSIKVEIFPPDTAATEPFFSTTLQAFQWLPSFPFSTKYMPMDITLVQPPLPASNKPGEEILCGTNCWFKLLPEGYTQKARLMWVNYTNVSSAADKRHINDDHNTQENDISTETGREETASVTKWWPSLHPWPVGLWMDQATLIFGVPDVLE